jgi:alkylhydroperoxidase family enzyme
MSMRIKPVSDEDASPEVKRMFEALAAADKLNPFQRTLALKPAIMRAYNQLTGALWAEDSKLSPKLKDLAYLRASIIAGCEY